ncbi:response regulator transcription factor [Nocardia aurea]|jgi:DNA-binding CsgD family transcriptional regulator|uniref:response regulator transcription factor n=1 Tax=Nocardia aurea TaxID=2144174 RepID=UPI0033AF6D85
MNIALGHENMPLPTMDGQRVRPSLSSRETEVLLAWITSDSKAEVSRRLFISLGTVNTHLTRIRDKFAAVGRPAPTKAALVSRALQDGLIRLDEL